MWYKKKGNMTRGDTRNLFGMRKGCTPETTEKTELSSGSGRVETRGCIHVYRRSMEDENEVTSRVNREGVSYCRFGKPYIGQGNSIHRHLCIIHSTYLLSSSIFTLSSSFRLSLHLNLSQVQNFVKKN